MNTLNINQREFIIIFYCLFPFIYWRAAHIFHRSQKLDYENMEKYKEKKRKELIEEFGTLEEDEIIEKLKDIENTGEKQVDYYVGIYPLLSTVSSAIIIFFFSENTFDADYFLITTFINIFIVWIIRKRESISFFAYSFISSITCFCLLLYTKLEPDVGLLISLPIVIAYAGFLSLFTYGGLTLFNKRIENSVNKEFCSSGGYTRVYTKELGNRESHALERLFSFITGMIICVVGYSLLHNNLAS